MSTLISVLPEFKELLIMNDVKGDPWGVTMGAFFDCASHLYEKGECPAEWEYKVGWGGNHIDEESAYFDFFSSLSDEQLIEVGQYLHRITGILKAKGLSY